MRSSPSIVPADRLDRDIYLVLEDFGARAGYAWRETDEADTNLDIILQNLLSGQYTYPVRIVSFNAVAGCDFRGRRRTGAARSRHRGPRLQTSSPPTPQGASTCSSRCHRTGSPDVQRR